MAPDADALERLTQFVQTELARDDVPRGLRVAYEELLERFEDREAPDSATPVDELPLAARALAALRSAGIATAGQLAQMDEAARAALPYIGPLYLAQIRAALGELPARR
jgi:DNA-directed RNA polymerase alpha subunit